MGRKKVYANRLVSFLCRSPAGERAGYTSQKVITPDASSEPLIAYSGRRFFFGQKPKSSGFFCAKNQLWQFLQLFRAKCARSEGYWSWQSLQCPPQPALWEFGVISKIDVFLFFREPSSSWQSLQVSRIVCSFAIALSSKANAWQLLQSAPH